MKAWIPSTIFAGFVTAALSSVACAQSPSEPDEAAFDIGLAEMGTDVYLRRCAACHGVDGQGHGPAEAALRVPPPDLTKIAQRRGGDFPDGEIARFVDGRFDLPAHGSREMPIWGARLGETIPESSIAEEIVRGKIVTLIEYLKSIQRRDD